MTEVLRFLPLPLPAARQSAAAGRNRALFFNGLPEKLNLVIYSYPYAYVAHCWATGKKTWPTVGVLLPMDIDYCSFPLQLLEHY